MVDPNFEKDMRTRIVEVIEKYAPENTEFGWLEKTNTLGQCRSKRQLGSYKCSSVILISFGYVVNHPWEDVRGLLAHEIAHAKLPTEGHTPMWREVCISLGGDGKTYDTSPPVIKHLFEGTCPICGEKTYGYGFSGGGRCHVHDGKTVFFDWEYIGETGLVESVDILRENIGLVHVSYDNEKKIREKLEFGPDVDVTEWCRQFIYQDNLKLKAKRETLKSTLENNEFVLNFDMVSYSVLSARKKPAKKSKK